jgi:hypothetical protein
VTKVTQDTRDSQYGKSDEGDDVVQTIPDASLRWQRSATPRAIANDRPGRAEGPAIADFRARVSQINQACRARDGSKHFAATVLAHATSPSEQFRLKLGLAPRLALRAPVHMPDSICECGVILYFNASIQCEAQRRA